MLLFLFTLIFMSLLTVKYFIGTDDKFAVSSKILHNQFNLILHMIWFFLPEY